MTPPTVIVALLLVVAAVARDNALPENSKIVELSPADFADQSGYDPAMVAIFTAPKCKNCAELFAVMDAVAISIPNATIVMVDITKADATFLKKHRIQKLPMLRLYRHGTSSSIRADFTEESLTKTLVPQTTPASTQLTEDTHAAALAAATGKVVLVAALTSPNGLNAFQRAVEQLRDRVQLFYTTSDTDARAICAALALADDQCLDHLILLRPFDPKPATTEFRAHELSTSLLGFLGDNALPNGVTQYTLHNRLYFFSGAKEAALIVFVKDADGENGKKIQDALAAVQSPSVRVAVCDASGSLATLHLSRLGRSANDDTFPVVAIITQSFAHYPMRQLDDDEPLPIDELQEFVKAFEGGKLTPFTRSEPKPEKQAVAGKVVDVVGDTFDAVVLQPKKDVLLMAYSPTCPHCKKFSTVFEDVADALRKLSATVTVAQIDATQNDLPSAFKVEGYPTLFLSKKNDKSAPLTFSGIRSFDTVMKFLKDNADSKIEYEKPKTQSFDESAVVVLTSDNYHDTIETTPRLMVEWYAPWCKHCIKMAPEYAAAAKKLAPIGIALAKIDKVDNAELAAAEGITSFPTMFYYRNGQKLGQYKGPRDADSIAKFMSTTAFPISTELKDIEEIKRVTSTESMQKTGLAVALGLFKSARSLKMYESVFAGFRNALTIHHTFNKDYLKEVNLESTFVIFRPHNESVAVFPRDASVKEKSREFVRMSAFPQMVTFNRDNRYVFTGTKTILFALTNTNLTENPNNAKMFADMAEVMNEEDQLPISEFVFAACDPRQFACHPRLKQLTKDEFQGTTRVDFMFIHDGKPFVAPKDMPRTRNGLSKLIKDFRNGELSEFDHDEELKAQKELEQKAREEKEEL